MNFNNLDLNLLVVFDSIFDEGSITKASEKLNLSQSAVSNALNRLRYTMNDDLFFRSGDRMQPTPAALEFVGPIKKALELIDGTLTREGFNPAESEKRFVFCTPDVAASKVAAKVVQTLQEEAPKIKITNIALQNGVLERLKNHDIDFILAADPHMVQEMESPVGQRFDEYFDSFEVYRDTYRCVARKGHPLIKTPNLDQFAKEGVRLTQCYSACGVCSPSRSSILTGRTPYRNGVWRWIPAGHQVHLRTSEITIPEVLKAKGYTTCHAGKWHLNGFFNVSGSIKTY